MTRTFATAATVATAALLITVSACSRDNRHSAATNQSAAEERIARDDTAANTHAAVAAQDQSENDRALTRQIREAITADDSLSTSARNVTVITTDGVVTLRGPVANEQERNAVAAKAEGTTGVKRLDNRLEVTGPHS